MASDNQKAKAHARRVHVCSLCGVSVRGNGGWGSHRAMHFRRNGIEPSTVVDYGAAMGALCQRKRAGEDIK